MQVPRIAWCSIVIVLFTYLKLLGKKKKTPTGKDFNSMSIFNVRKGRRWQNLRMLHNSLGYFSKT